MQIRMLFENKRWVLVTELRYGRRNFPLILAANLSRETILLLGSALLRNVNKAHDPVIVVCMNFVVTISMLQLVWLKVFPDSLLNQVCCLNAGAHYSKIFY